MRTLPLHRTPGAKVTVNGRAVIPQNIGPGGCFIDAQFIKAGEAEIVKSAPRRAPVTRLDEVAAARTPVLTHTG